MKSGGVGGRGLLVCCLPRHRRDQPHFRSGSQREGWKIAEGVENSNNHSRVTSAEAVPDHGDLLQRVLQFPFICRVVVDGVVDLILGGEEMLSPLPVQLLEAAVTLEDLPRA